MIFLNKTRDIKNLNKFLEEAKELNSKIEYVIKFGDDDLRFTLSEALSAEEDSDLDNLVSTFDDSDPDLAIPKIIALAKPQAQSKGFSRIIYTGTIDLVNPLFPKRTIIQGEIQKVEWYSSYDVATDTLSNLVLEVDISYTRDANGMALYRHVTRTWINEDETRTTLDPKIKYYTINKNDMIDEGIKRRSLLVKSVQIPCLTAITQVLVPLGYSETASLLKGRQFMDDMELEFKKFIDNSSSITNPSDPNYGKKSIVVAMENENRPEVEEWLDGAPPVFGGTMTIRQWLIGEFTI